jgi:hypothetical protein
MSEKKAVLNVTVPQEMADAVRAEAADRDVTISSVVEAALAEQLKWYKIRAEGLAAMDELYQQIGYPTPEEEAEAAAWNDGVERQLAQALADEARAPEARCVEQQAAGAA